MIHEGERKLTYIGQKGTLFENNEKKNITLKICNGSRNNTPGTDTIPGVDKERHDK